LSNPARGAAPATHEKRAGMCWFRSNIRFGARLALFALAFQTALTFNHIHLDGLNGSLCYRSA